MPNRPALPVGIKTKVLLESAHRCAVCGTGTPLEFAHIIPWHKTQTHKIEDLLCLCANCHERADKEKWGTKTLREYKTKPWVSRNFENLKIKPDSYTQIKITIDYELKEFDDIYQRLLRYSVAAFLNISPNNVKIS